MKRAICICLGVVLVCAAACAGTIANVVSNRERMLTIDRGDLDGVRIGMKGTIKAVYKDPSGEYDMNIGLFEVRRTEAHRADVYVESIGQGLNPEDARYVVFDQTLKPETVGNETPRIPTPAAGNSVDALLESGDKALAAGNFTGALDFFQQALNQDPQNLIAREKIVDARNKITERESKGKFSDYLKKADGYMARNDVEYAFLYLVQALKVYPAGDDEIRRRLQLLAKTHGPQVQKILDEKESALDDVRPQLSRMLDLPVGTAETPIPINDKPAHRSANEPLAERIRNKARNVLQNGKGYWEAEFADHLVLIEIPEGVFTVGSPASQGDSDEHPAHKAMIPVFWIGKYEVTFDQFDRYCRETNRSLPVDNGWGRGSRPVINVSWQEAADFCRWLSDKTGLPFRLPTEAEWEKSCHGFFPWGDAKPTTILANFEKHLGRTAPVGSCPAGASRYGVLDLAGNVWEWLADWYAADYYGRSPGEAPRGPTSGTERSVRGGAWSNGPALIRSANRSAEKPDNRLNIIGFRVAIGDN